MILSKFKDDSSIEFDAWFREYTGRKYTPHTDCGFATSKQAKELKDCWDAARKSLSQSSPPISKS